VAKNRYYTGPATNHFDGTRFFNPNQPSTDRSLKQLLQWQTEGGKSKWPTTVPAQKTVKPEQETQRCRITMIGHASVLIQQAGYNILIDPVYSERASPLPFVGPKRVNGPGIAFDDLPRIDAILITHNHYDHLDIATLKRLTNAHKPRIIAPLGNDMILKRATSTKIECGDWHDTFTLTDAIKLTLVAAHHWSARTPGDRRMALWCGFVIESDTCTTYCAGDTGYGDGQIFRDIKARFGAPDVAILPIGAYEPRWFMKDQHTNPDEAVQIMLDCGARYALGAHWGTFPLANESRTAPREALHDAIERRGISPDRFIAVEPGDIWTNDR
jgi:L-ascorbate metabolism protein UlaG (beta-lactamase superfamily)